MFTAMKLAEAGISCGGKTGHFGLYNGDTYCGLLHIHICPDKQKVEIVLFPIGGRTFYTELDIQSQNVDEYIVPAIRFCTQEMEEAGGLSA